MNLTPLLEQILCVVSVMLNTHIVNHKIVVLKTYYLFTLNADTFIVLASLFVIVNDSGASKMSF